MVSYTRMRKMEKDRVAPGVGVLDRLPSVRVLVVGDAMMDRFVYGSVERISPEAPVPVFRPSRTIEMPGGAGNTAVNLSALGCKVRLVARTGFDAMSARLSDALKRQGVSVRFSRQKAWPTSVKTRFIAGNNHVLRVDEEQITEIDTRQLSVVRAAVRGEIAKCDIVVLSDYGKGFLSASLLKPVISDCKRAGIPVVVDPKSSEWSKYAGATLVKPNLKEFSEAAGRKFNPGSANFCEEIVGAAKALLSRHKIGGLLITLGEHGMIYVPAGGSRSDVIRLPTRAREVFDVSGAGDTTIAALAAAIGAGAGMPEAMQIANAAAGIVVGKVGTASVSASELMEALSGTGGNMDRKMLPLPVLCREIAALRRKGVKVGFTNGCFDCCHLGHLTSLREAKRLCDVLVVGVNSDAWIRRHKGKDRPLQDMATRTALLAALECVDYVVAFDDETALPLVRKLRPDVIAKEGYAMKDWPEGRYVESIGGKAVTLRRVEGYSTTAIAKRAGAK